MQRRNLILNLFEIGGMKFGSYKLKSGFTSPIYIDLRLIVSYPEILKEISEVMWSTIKALEFDMLCGVPYTALPIATAMSLAHGKPMVMRRKEIKEHGTRKAIEGSFTAGQTCLVIEDLITSGSSIFETIAPLEEEGLRVSDAAVLIDREQGGRISLLKQGYNLHAAFQLSEVLRTLEIAGKIDTHIVSKVKDYICENQVGIKQ